MLDSILEFMTLNYLIVDWSFGFQDAASAHSPYYASKENVHI